MRSISVLKLCLLCWKESEFIEIMLDYRKRDFSREINIPVLNVSVAKSF